MKQRGRNLHFVFLATAGMLLAVAGGCAPHHGGSLPVPRIRPLHHLNSRPTQSSTIRNGVPSGWIPKRNAVKGRWEGILIHHTATATGPASVIDRLHKARGFDGLGYHFVINNGRGAPDGRIEVGRRWQEQREGAHCRVDTRDDNHWNECTIGLALIGNFEQHRPTEAQYRSLVKLVRFLRTEYAIPMVGIQGHEDIKPTKCPGKYFDMAKLKRLVRAELSSNRR